jgi:hypothetical protein
MADLKSESATPARRLAHDERDPHVHHAAVHGVHADDAEHDDGRVEERVGDEQFHLARFPLAGQPGSVGLPIKAKAVNLE